MDATESDDVRGGISFEDQNFFVGYDEEGTPTEAERQRFLGISTKLKLLVERVVQDFNAAKDTEGLPGKGMLKIELPSPAKLQKLKVAESKWRKITQRFEFLLQIGVGDELMDMMDSAFWHLANTMLKQRDDREDEAQKMVLAQLSKSVANIGPYRLNTVEKLKTLARSIGTQGYIELCVCILRMAYVLLKHGEDKDAGGSKGMTYLDQLRVDIVMILQENIPHSSSLMLIAQDAAEPLLREHVDVLHTRAAQGHGYESSDASEWGIEWLSFRLGTCLLEVGKHSEAEEVLDKALHLSLELLGIKSVEQRLEELQGMSNEDLAEMREAGLAVPMLPVEKVAKIMAEETFIQDLVTSSVTSNIMASLSQSLMFQQREHPEKLPKAETLSRLALNVRQRHPEFGPEDGGTLKSMTDLASALAGQHKYVAALSVNAKAISIRLRIYPPGHPALKGALDRQKELIRKQAEFRAEAEEILGPRDTWSDDEDGRPASVMFERTVQDAARRRTASSTKSHKKHSKDAEPEFEPISYNAADQAEINLAALMAGCGVVGLRVVTPKKKGKQSFIDLETLTPKEPFGGSKGARCWGSVIALMYQHLTLPASPSNMESPQGIKLSALMAAMSSSGTKEILESVQASMTDMANGNREVVVQMREDKKNQPEEREATPIKRSKPKRVCLACGAYGAKRRCTRCHKAYFCDKECLARGWKSFHKASCVPREE